MTWRSGCGVGKTSSWKRCRRPLSTERLDSSPPPAMSVGMAWFPWPYTRALARIERALTHLHVRQTRTENIMARINDAVAAADAKVSLLLTKVSETITTLGELKVIIGDGNPAN